MAASVEEFSYELTAGALAEQERALNALRTRSGTVLAAASISGSFLGTKVSHGSLDAWAILALVAFVLCLGAAIWVLLPHDLVFAFRGEALLGASDQEGVEDVGEAFRAVGRWIEPYIDANRDKIASLSSWIHRQLCDSGCRDHLLDREPGGLTCTYGCDRTKAADA